MREHLKTVHRIAGASIAAFMTLCFAAHAQTTSVASGERAFVAFSVLPEMNAATLQVTDCSFHAMAVSGDAVIFQCAPHSLYAVTYTLADSGQRQDRYGVLQLAPEATPNNFSALPVHRVLEYKVTPAAGMLFARALTPDLQPLLDVTDATVPDLPEGGSEDVAQDEAPAVMTPAEETGSDEPASDSVADTGADTASDPDAVSVLLQWADIYGRLRIEGGPLVEIETKASGVMIGKMYVTADMGTEITLISERNPKCSNVYTVGRTDAGPIGLITMACQEFPFNIPTSFTISSSECRQEGATQYSCLLKDGDSVTLSKSGWTTFDLPAGQVEPAQVLQSLMGLQPRINIEALQQTMAENQTSSCGVAALDVRMAGYCAAENCQDLQNGPLSIFGQAGFPDLAAANWNSQPLPDSVMLELVSGTGDAQVVLKQQTLAIDLDFARQVAEFSTSEDGIAEYPVVVDLAPGQYKVGRTLQFYADDMCRTTLAGKVFNLSNPGNSPPEVTQCSYYQMADSGRPRSSCNAVVIDTAAGIARAAPEMDQCGAQKLVILVAESRSLNGVEGQEMQNAVEAYAASMKTSETCIQVDIARSIEERREILLSSEDAFFDRNNPLNSDRIDMSFVNRASEILRDMEWIYRTWGDQLGGLVIVGDGSLIRAGDMIDSPAAMAWELKGVKTHFLDLSERPVCDLLENTLFFDSCTESSAETIGGEFQGVIATGLKTLGDGN